jgi:hypothetical protein
VLRPDHGALRAVCLTMCLTRRPPTYSMRANLHDYVDYRIRITWLEMLAVLETKDTLLNAANEGNDSDRLWSCPSAVRLAIALTTALPLKLEA